MAGVGDRKRDGTVRLERVPWWDVDTWWSTTEIWIEAAFAGRSIVWTTDDIRGFLTGRVMDLWLAMDGDEPLACAVTRIDRFPRAAVCVILAAGGRDMKAWLDLQPDLVRWAKAQGCDALETPGRKGWERVLADRGWSPVWTVYRKEL